MFASRGREEVAKRAKRGEGVTGKRLDKHLEREHPSIYSWELRSGRLESLSDYCIRLRLRSVKQKCRLRENSAPTVCLYARRPQGFTSYSLGCISVTVVHECKVRGLRFLLTWSKITSGGDSKVYDTIELKRERSRKCVFPQATPITWDRSGENENQRHR